MSNFVHILSYTATTDEVPFPNVSEKDRSLPKYFLLKDRPTQNFLQTKNKNIFFYIKIAAFSKIKAME